MKNYLDFLRATKMDDLCVFIDIKNITLLKLLQVQDTLLARSKWCTWLGILKGCFMFTLPNTCNNDSLVNTLYLDINPSTAHTSLINSELAQVQTWISASKLSLNAQKTD